MEAIRVSGFGIKNRAVTASALYICFTAGMKKHLPQAEITFDRFHIMKIVIEAVDEIRRQEPKETDLLRKTRYLWLKNPGNLTTRQHQQLDTLKHHNNSLLQAAKSRARGYRTNRNFINMAYLIAGKLDFGLPT